MSYAIEDNKALIYLLEQFLNNMPNIKVTAQTKRIDVLLKYFPLFFDGQFWFLAFFFSCFIFTCHIGPPFKIEININYSR